MKKRWFIKENDFSKQNLLVQELNISPVIAQLLVNRNMAHPYDASKFLDANLSSLYDPFLLKNMEKSVDRIKKALSKGEKILVYGDYDVDGITSVALASRILKDMGGNVIEYIPSRIEEGYGLNLEAAQQAYRKSVTLIITFDCGISALKEVDYLNSRGIDTIIIDHHKPDNNILPRAYAIVDPLQEDCDYPFKYLAGVGLAFKLAQALTGKKTTELTEHLDLVALGTISDIAPQVDENRVLTKHGLDSLTKTKNVGIRELMRVSGLGHGQMRSRHVGYILGPRINASGRISSPKLALKLLTTANEEEAAYLAKVLDQENRNRQKIESDLYEEALDKVEKEVNFKTHRVIVLSNENWHHGVIGIVASRLVKKFYRPTVIISITQHTGRGSARSIKNFHLFDAISRCKEFLVSFGGHEGACGLTILCRNIDKFRDFINDVAGDLLSPEDLLPSLEADMELPLCGLSDRLISQIDELNPYGPGNPQPLFIANNVTIKHKPRFVGKRGVKFWVNDGRITCEALMFGSHEYLNGISKESVINLAYTPSLNEWKGLRSIKLDVEDINFGG